MKDKIIVPEQTEENLYNLIVNHGFGEVIRADFFKNHMHYPTEREFKAKKQCELCGHVEDYFDKTGYETQKSKYIMEDRRLHNLFKTYLFKEFAVTENPKAEMAFQKAWDKGHSSGYYDIYLEFGELVDLIR